MKAIHKSQLPSVLTELLFESASAHDIAALVEPRGHLVRKFDRAELVHFVSLMARGLNATNLRRGSKVALRCKTSAKAIIVCFANLLNGAVNVVLPEDSTLEEQLHALSTSRAEALVVDSIEAAIPLLKNIKNLPQLRQIIVLSEADFAKQPEILCMSWKEVTERGEKQPDRTALLRQAITSDAEAFLYFERDASGRMRGKMQTHMQMSEQLDEMMAMVSIPARARMISIVPFHYPQSFVATALLPLAAGRSVMMMAPEESWKIESLSPRETVIIASAALFNGLADKVALTYSEAGGVTGIAWRRACSLGAWLMQQEIPALSGWRVMQAALWRNLMGGVLREHTAGHLLAAIAVDAVPKPETIALIRGIGAASVALHAQAQVMLEMRAAEG